MIDTAALREKILNLAIRGKLVPQDPNDEPASKLLERIRAQKLQMVKEGKLKAKDVKDDTIIYLNPEDNCHYEKFADGTEKNIEDEIPFDLPNGWCWARIASISIINPRNNLDDNLMVSFIPMPLIEEGYNNDHSSEAREWKQVKSGFTHFAEGDIAVAKITPCFENKKSVIFNNLTNGFGAGTTELHIIRLLENTVVPKYILWNAKTDAFIADGINAFSGAVGQKRIGRDFIANYLLPIPPVNEQHKIVEIIETSFTSINEIEMSSGELDKIKSLIKSKILDLAIQGKLVPQDENDEPASVLLERIRAEKKAQLGKKYIESYIYKGDDNCYYENNNENPIKIPFNLPKNWEFSRLFNLAWLEDGEKNKGELLPYLDAKTLRGKQELVMVSEGKIVEARTKVILVDGENSGEVFEVPFRGYIGSTFKVLQVSNFVEKEFVKIILDFYKTLFKDNKTGSAIPHLNKKIFKSLIVGVPPINEQKRIISKVNAVMMTLKDEI